MRHVGLIAAPRLSWFRCFPLLDSNGQGESPGAGFCLFVFLVISQENWEDSDVVQRGEVIMKANSIGIKHHRNKLL